MKEKLEEIKKSVQNVIRQTYLCAESLEMAAAADEARESIALIDSILAELDSAELVEKVTNATREASAFKVKNWPDPDMLVMLPIEKCQELAKAAIEAITV